MRWTDSGRFGAIQTSGSVADQGNLRNVVGRRSDLGVIAKRPIATRRGGSSTGRVGIAPSCIWRWLWDLRLDSGELGWPEFALRFSAYAQSVNCAIVGTSKASEPAPHVEADGRGPWALRCWSKLTALAACRIGSVHLARPDSPPSA